MAGIRFRYLLGILSFAWTTVSCESKFTEAVPEKVEVKGISLEDRASQKNQVDTRIDEIQNFVKTVNDIITMFKRVQSPSMRRDVYTPLEFILDVNERLKLKLPEEMNNKLVRTWTEKLKSDLIPENCKDISVQLSLDPIFDDLKGNQVGERLTYALKTCGSESRFLDAVSVDWVKSTLAFKMNTKNFRTLFGQWLFDGLMQEMDCKVTQDSKNILDEVRCQNLDLSLSESQLAKIKEVVFKNSGKIRFEANADILENKKVSDSVSIVVYSDGDVKVERKNKEAENKTTSSEEKKTQSNAQ